MRPLAAASLTLPLLAALAAADLPRHPDAIEFAPLAFEPPDAADFRHELPGGVPVYLAPSREFPLVNIVFTFRGGSHLDPPDAIGLVSAMAASMRRGGTAGRSPDELDEEFDFLAANVSVAAGSDRVVAEINCLAGNLDEALALFAEMLRSPGFDEAKFALWKDEQLAALRQRNDDPAAVSGREWRALLFGRDHPEGWVMRSSDLERIDTEAMRAMHAGIVHPGNLVIAVDGDFDEAEMLSRLASLLEGWPRGERSPDPAPPGDGPSPGVRHLERDIPQARVLIGHRAGLRDDPDAATLRVLDDILGAGGFTSRVTQRIRSDEGLAYSAFAVTRPRLRWPGEWRAGFQTRNETAAFGTKIVLEELERIRTEPVSQQELETAVSQIVETFPRSFENRAGTLAIFVDDELTDRPAGHWRTWRDRIRAVSPEAIRAAAQRHLHPDRLVVLTVGRWDEIARGDLEGRASMAELFGDEVEMLPLRDPLTQMPMR